jgi:pilus assembly protein CpaB
VNKEVPKGAAAGTIKSSVSMDRIPRRLEQPGAVVNLGAIDNKVAAVDLLPGDQLVSARLASSTTPNLDGKVQISADLTADRAVGGALNAGDTVGVYLSFSPSCGGGVTSCPAPDPKASATQLEFQHVLVTNVQSTGTPVGQKSGSQVQEVSAANYIVTLALTPAQSERFVFASEFGHIWLSNEPASVSGDGTQLITLGNVYSVVAP